MKDFLRRTAGPCLVGLIIGGALASGFWIIQYRAVCNEWAKTEATGQIVQDVETLASIRGQGKEKTMELKEGDLGDDVWALSLAFSPKELSDSNSVRALKLAIAYRNQHPFSTGDTNIDEAVETFLANFKTK